MAFDEDVGILIFLEDHGKFAQVLLSHWPQVSGVDIEENTRVESDLDPLAHPFDGRAFEIPFNFGGLFVHVIADDAAGDPADRAADYGADGCIAELLADDGSDRGACAASIGKIPAKLLARYVTN